MLRAVEPEDADRLYIWENNRDIWPYGGTRAPLSRHQLWEYANNYDANPFSSGQLRLIIEACRENSADGAMTGRQPCGTIDLYEIDPLNSRAFVGIMVIPAMQGKGIALESLRMLEEYCRDTLGLTLLAADVPSDNLPSINLFRSAGYILTGDRPSWFRRDNGFVSCTQFQKRLNINV